MKYQDPELQAQYERGKRQAQEIWGEFLSDPDSMSGPIQCFRNARDQYERLSRDLSIRPHLQRDYAERAAHHNGWLDAWRRRK